MTATAYLEIPGDPDKLPMGLNFWELLFSSCANVQDVLDFLDRYDLGSVPGYFEQGQMLWSDASGDSAIVEGSMIYRRGDAAYQIITNFLHSHPELGGFPCPRYVTIEGMLSSGEELSDAYLMDVVEAAHGTAWGGYTVWSLLYDPVALEVALFYQGDFSQKVKIDLAEELALVTPGHDFELLFNRCPGDHEPATVPAALMLERCGTVLASFDCSGDTDVFGFTPPATGTHVIATLGAQQTHLRVLDKYGTGLASALPSTAGQNTVLEVELLAGEPISIHLRDMTGAIGAYELSVEMGSMENRRPRRPSGRRSDGAVSQPSTVDARVL
jgi:hypothetical protein